MSDPRQMIVVVAALLSVIGVVAGVGTYNGIQREREKARAEVVAALEDVRGFCERFVSGCDRAQTVLTETRKLYVDYLGEIQSTGTRLGQAEARRRELISECNARDVRFAELASQAEQDRMEAIQRLSGVENQLKGSQKLTRADKGRLDADVSRCRQQVDALDSRLAQLKQLHQNNRQLVDEMSNSALLFLDAVKKAQEAERQVQQLQEETNGDMRYVQESKEVIQGILRDTQRSLESIRSR